MLKLLWRYMHRLVYQDGRYREMHRGIPLGCPLSPLMGALYLRDLDDRMAETGLFYARFMDDSVVLAPTRWKLRRAIKAVNLGAGGAEGGTAPGQDLHRADQPGV